LHGSFTFEFHQFISLLAIAFLATHVIVLLFDQYLTFSVFQILIPFISAYRPFWVGVGILSLYLVLLVTVTFYLRDRIGQKSFRSIHTLSLLGFLGAAFHGLLSGTDSPLPMMKIMYAGTLFSVIFLSTYWLADKYLKRQPAQAVRSVQR
jgi:predicted ferric reductase